MNKHLSGLISSVLLIVIVVGSLPSSSKAQVRPVYDMGVIGLGQILRRLQTTASVMHTGADPDDEDSGLLAWLARGENARTAYLSLNRGEGGQNIIGPELFDALGVIRTEELLQARRLDGGQQFFTSVIDYGFSKTLAEAKRIWDEKQTLGEMVRAIRLFRPLVIIARFTGTPADGHGQHQFSGYLTPMAFKAAADPAQFPEQLREGLEPWQALKFYVSQNFESVPPNPSPLILNIGQTDTLIGRSYFEIAMEGRSQHKSQKEGLLELRGDRWSGVRLVESRAAKPEHEKSVFDGIDTSISGIPALAGLNNDFLNEDLKKAQSAAEKAMNTFDPFNPKKTIEPLAEGLHFIRQAQHKVSESSKSGQTPPLIYAGPLLAQKEAEFSKALQMAAGVVVDALCDKETIVPGDSTDVAVRVFAPDPAGLKINGVSLKTPAGWTTAAMRPPSVPTVGFRPPEELAVNASFFTVTVPANARYTQAYWLEKPRRNYTFDWSADDAEKNKPFQSPLVSAAVKMEIGGEEINISKDVQYRYADDVRGEIRRELNVVPLVNIAPDSNLLVASVLPETQKKQISVLITNNGSQEFTGTAKLDLPDGWLSTPAAAEFSLKQKGEKAALTFDVTIPANVKPDAYHLTAEALVNGRTFDQTGEEIAYPHIQTHRRYRKAEILAQIFNLKTVPVRVGYIMGSGDAVPAAIRLMGLDVTMLAENDLAAGDLSKFDTIVVGIRASQVRPDFSTNNTRLMDFVKNGGTLIVQYQQADYARKNLAPFPAGMTDTQKTTGGTVARVVDENAKVTILEPANSVFNFPNKITDADFQNWVQERNLFNFTTLDAKYHPLLESHDEGEQENKGGMVYAEIGKGKYVYTSYTWFRQLPSGNPGAYRIFANLLSLPKAVNR